MSTFAQLSQLPGVGVAYLLEASFDDFATVSYYWATHHIKIGSAQYDGVISQMGNLSRALGVDNTVTAATVEITIDNTQGIADWLLDRATFISQTLRAVFRLKVALFDPSNPSDLQWMQLGLFSSLDYPKRDNATVKLSLADDLFARGGQLAQPPSVWEWYQATDAARPGYVRPGAYGVNPNFDFYAPAPLLFGAGPHPIQRVSQGVYLICAVAGDRATQPTPVMSFYDKEGFPFPTSTPGTSPVPVRSANFTRAGDSRTWHMLYVILDIHPTSNTLRGRDYFPDVQSAASSGVYFADQDVVGPVMAVGSPFSQVSNFNGTGEGAVVHPATVVQDLLTAYPQSQTTITVNTASFDSIRALHPTLQASGRVQPAATPTAEGSFRQLELQGAMDSAVGGLSRAGLFDTVYGKNNSVYAKALANDFSTITSTPTTLDEPLMRGVTETIPSKGERYEPCTTIDAVWNGKHYPDGDTWATVIGRKLEHTVDVSWLAPDTPHPVPAVNVSQYFNTSTAQIQTGRWRDFARDAMRVRPVLSFRTSLAALSLELGDLVSITWGRGSRGTPYNAARFRVEGWTLSPFDADGVALKLVWVDEAASLGLNPFLLDDETLITRCTGSGGRTLTVTNGSTTVDFSSGSLITDGVQPWDILVVQDPTEAGNAFKRNRALLILTVNSATQIDFSSSKCSTDFGATVSGISAWAIYRGARTYPTAVSDPTNYPQGGAMYGKISDHANAGKFSDGTTLANILQDG